MNRTRHFGFPATGGFQFPVPPPFQDTGEIDLWQTGLRWNDPDFDNSVILEDLIVDAAETGRTLVCRKQGTLYFCKVDAATHGNLTMDFIPGVTFYGLERWLTTDSGNPGQIAGNQVAGSVLALRGGTPSGNRAFECHLRNLRVDNSQRAYEQDPLDPTGLTGAGGTATALFNWNLVYTENYRAFAGTDFRGIYDPDTGLWTPKGDSGITTNTCNNSTHVNMWCRGQPDLGLYQTGDPPIPGDPAGPDHPGDPDYLNRGGHTLINPIFVDCKSGMKATRASRRLRIIGGQAVRCSCGVFLPDMSGQAAPGNADLSSDHFFNCYEFIIMGFMGKRITGGFIRVGPGQRGSIIGCQLEDWGYQPVDGTFESHTSGGIRAAYSLEGCSQTHWNGCRAWFRDWDPVEESADPLDFLYGFRAQAFTTDAASGSVVYECHDNVFEGCMIEGANRGYFEEDLTYGNRGVIYHREGGANGIQLRPGSDSQVVDGDTPVNNTVDRLEDTDLTISYASARINRFRGVRTANRSITFPSLSTTMRGREYHISNETTGGYTLTITQLGSGGAGTKALSVGQWADVIWNGIALELLRFGSI